MMDGWVTLKEWGRLHSMDVRTVKKMIEDGIIGVDDYFHYGHTWRVRVEVNFRNKAIQLHPYDGDYLRALEAV